jgi:uncharacterized membrane protein YdjX (TVP38/TMEM64 family)
MRAERLPIGRIVAGIAGVVALIVLGRVAGRYLPAAARWVDGLGPWGPVAFVLLYAAAVVAFIPAAPLTLAAGAIFGLARGVVYVFVAATLGSALAFLVARYVARRAVERRLTGNRFAAIDRAVAAEGRKVVFLLRLSPVFPFTLLNYVLGLTRVGFGDYMLGAFGMIPGTILYVYYGTLAGNVLALAGGAPVEKGAGYWTVLAIGLIATVAVTTVVTRIARRALREATGE